MPSLCIIEAINQSICRLAVVFNSHRYEEQAHAKVLSLPEGATDPPNGGVYQMFPEYGLPHWQL
jgi:hypothetical protein